MAPIHYMVPLATILNFQFIMNGMPLGHTQDNTPSSIIITGHYSLSWLAQSRLLTNLLCLRTFSVNSVPMFKRGRPLGFC